MGKCEKCGKEIDHVLVENFTYTCHNLYVKAPIIKTEYAAVEIDVDRNWKGLNLKGEEMYKTIQCPHCRQIPTCLHVSERYLR